MENEIVAIEKERNEIVSKVESLNITNTETFQGAVDLGSIIKKFGKKIKEIMDFHTKGFKAEVKKVEAQYKPGIEECSQLEAKVKSKIIAYQEEQEKIRMAEEERLRKQQQKEYEKTIKKAEKKGDAVPPPPPPVKVEQPKVDGLQIRKIWVAEIEDVKLLPENVLRDLSNTEDGKEVISKYLQKLVKAGIRTIPGVRIFEKSISAISTKEKEDDL